MAVAATGRSPRPRVAVASTLLLCASAVTLGAGAQDPASARSGLTLSFSTSRPIAGERITASGRAPTDFRRTVVLRVSKGGSWSVSRRATTSRTGGYAFHRIVTTGNRSWSVLVPAVRHGGTTYPSRVSRVRTTTVTAQSAAADTLPAVAQRGTTVAPSSDARGVVSARFTPARPGRTVRFQQRQDDGSWLTVGTTTQDAGGRATWLGETDGRTTRATTTARSGAPAVTTADSATDWRQSFDDEFSGDQLDLDLWHHRDAPAPARTQTTNDPRTVSVSGGRMRMQVLKDPDHPGKLLNGQISTQGQYDFTYGFAAARVKFPQGRGQHGAFWVQTPTYASYPGDPERAGAELDVVEFFGDGYKGGGLGSTVWYYGPHGERSGIGGVQANAEGLKPAGDSWWRSYHVFSVNWTPTGYTFYIDGRVLRTVHQAVSRRDQYLILSMLTSDWELPKLDRSTVATPPGSSSKHTMSVDWVKVWKSADAQ